MDSADDESMPANVQSLSDLVQMQRNLAMPDVSKIQLQTLAANSLPQLLQIATERFDETL